MESISDDDLVFDDDAGFKKIPSSRVQVPDSTATVNPLMSESPHQSFRTPPRGSDSPGAGMSIDDALKKFSAFGDEVLSPNDGSMLVSQRSPLESPSIARTGSSGAVRPLTEKIRSLSPAKRTMSWEQAKRTGSSPELKPSSPTGNATPPPGERREPGYEEDLEKFRERAQKRAPHRSSENIGFDTISPDKTGAPPGTSDPHEQTLAPGERPALAAVPPDQRAPSSQRPDLKSPPQLAPKTPPRGPVISRRPRPAAHFAAPADAAPDEGHKPMPSKPDAPRRRSEVELMMSFDDEDGIAAENDPPPSALAAPPEPQPSQPKKQSVDDSMDRGLQRRLSAERRASTTSNAALSFPALGVPRRDPKAIQRATPPGMKRHRYCSSITLFVAVFVAWVFLIIAFITPVFKISILTGIPPVFNESVKGTMTYGKLEICYESEDECTTYSRGDFPCASLGRLKASFAFLILSFLLGVVVVVFAFLELRVHSILKAGAPIGAIVMLLLQVLSVILLMVFRNKGCEEIGLSKWDASVSISLQALCVIVMTAAVVVYLLRKHCNCCLPRNPYEVNDTLEQSHRSATSS